MWSLLSIMTFGHIFVQVRECTGENIQRTLDTAEKEVGLEMRQAVSLNSPITATFAEHLQTSQREALKFAAGLLGTPVNNNHVPDCLFILFL